MSDKNLPEMASRRALPGIGCQTNPGEPQGGPDVCTNPEGQSAKRRQPCGTAAPILCIHAVSRFGPLADFDVCTTPAARRGANGGAARIVAGRPRDCVHTCPRPPNLLCWCPIPERRRRRHDENRPHPQRVRASQVYGRPPAHPRRSSPCHPGPAPCRAPTAASPRPGR